MKDVFIGQIGVRGQRLCKFFRENKPTTVNVMRMNGSSKQYLREVDEQSEEMLFRLGVRLMIE